MKAIHSHIYFILALFCLAAQSKAQNNVGIGTSSPNAKALLELYSTNKGLLVPRLDRNAIVTPTASDEGLLVYDINDHRFFYWTANVWEPIPDLDWIISGINQYSGVAGNVGIGTSTPQAKLHTFGTLRFENLSLGNDNEVLIVNAIGDVSRRTIPATVWNDNDPNPSNELNISLLYDPITHIISISDGESVFPLRSIIFPAASIAFSNSNCSAPHEKLGMCFGGKPSPKILAETPQTVPVLNIVLIAHFE